jgi:glycopeptide antibiotics resistance protein
VLSLKTKYQELKIFKFIWITYSFFIIYGTVIPFNIVPSNEFVLSNFGKISWLPFIDPDGSRASIPDVVQNILLFFPFGIISFLSLNQRKLSRIFLATLFGSLLSLFVEILQLFTTDRTTSITDLVTNSAGAFLGASTAAYTLDMISKAIASRSLRNVIQAKYFFPFFVCSIIVIAGSLHPFDFSLDIGSLWSKIKFLVNEPIKYRYVISDEGVIFIRFFLFGLICSLCFQQWQYPFSVMKGIILSCLIGLALECCQIIIKSRMPSIHDATVVLFSSICGGLFAAYRRRLGSPNIWPVIMIVATWAAAMLHTLSPFRFAAEYRSINWFPFLPYYDKTTFIALSNFIESVLIYYPMGFVIAHFMDRKKSPYIFTGIITSLIAIPLEFSQGWIDGRYPDITDVIGALIGAIFGAWTCREGWKAFERKIEYRSKIKTGLPIF